MRSSAVGCIVAALAIMGAFGVIIFISINNHPTTRSSIVFKSDWSNSGPPSEFNDGRAFNKPSGQLMFKTSETYYDRVQSVANRWNSRPRISFTVQMLKKEGSRSAQKHISNPTGDEPPADIWLSSTEELVQNLAATLGPKRVNLEDSESYVLFPPQPMVFLVRGRVGHEVDSYLRKVNPLPSLPKNQFTFSCADVLKSGGGESAARYLIWSNNQSGGKKSFETYLKDLKERGFVKRLKDSGPLAADFVSDSQLTFVLLHKALAEREKAKPNSNVHIILPKWTIFERPEAVLLQNGPDRFNGRSKEFLTFLRSELHLNSVSGSQEIDSVGQVQNEMRTWEKVFNNSQRLDTP